MNEKLISKDVLDHLIKDILDSFTITKEGTVQWSGNQVLIYRRNIDFFYSILLDDLDFSKRLKQKRYSFTPTGSVFFGKELLSIFKELKKEANPTFDKFKEELNKKIDEIAKIPTKEFTLVYPLNFKFIKKINDRFKEDKFEIVSFDDFKSNLFDIDKKLQEAKSKNDIRAKVPLFSLKEVCNNKFSFFVIKVYARNYFFAEEYATEKLLFILGLIIFAKHYRNSPITIVGKPKKLSRIVLSKVLIFEQNNFVISADFNEQITSFEDVNDNDINNFLNTLKLYNKINVSEVIEILKDVLKSYYEAATDEDIAYSFFKYWICIEFCLLKSRSITESEIIKRLKSMIRSEDKYLILRIDKLYVKRNNLVHQLKMNITQFDRNLTKSISESLIEFLLDNANNFSNKNELNLFYKFVQEDNQSLEADKKMIDLIIKFRKTDEGNKNDR